MPRISEINGGQTAMAALLKDGLTQLSGDQHVIFRLYRKFVSPLDGLVYWVRVINGSGAATVAMTAGLAHQTIEGRRSIQVAPGGVGAQDILSGRITNPLSAVDQTLKIPEVIHCSLAGPASHRPGDGWTAQVWPGDSFEIPAQPEFGAWVQSPTGGHKFTVRLTKVVSSLSGQPLTIEQAGSLHYGSEIKQDEDAVLDENTVVFTSKDEIQAFNLISPDELYIGERDDIRFSFSSRGYYYEAADLFHYMGQALYSINKPLIIDDPVGWEPDLVVSNSLPIWLSFPGYVSPYPALKCPFSVYPSYLAPDNVRLPYASIHIEETRALAPTPHLGTRMERDQLVSDRVGVVLYGATARTAADFMDFAFQYMRDAGHMGMMQHAPVIADDHRPQPEYRILAQKKTITFEVSYLQSVARDMARQVIKRALRVHFYPDQEHVEPPAPIVQTWASAIQLPSLRGG